MWLFYIAKEAILGTGNPFLLKMRVATTTIGVASRHQLVLKMAMMVCLLLILMTCMLVLGVLHLFVIVVVTVWMVVMVVMVVVVVVVVA